jgi:hypothetical protein
MFTLLKLKYKAIPYKPYYYLKNKVLIFIYINNIVLAY